MYSYLCNRYIFWTQRPVCPAACFLIPIIAIVGVLAMIHAVSAAALCRHHPCRQCRRCKVSLGVYTQTPVEGLQVSTAQSTLSVQTLLSCWQPVAGSQLSVVHLSLSSQFNAVPDLHTLLAHLSPTVQALPSSQDTVLAAFTQPVAVLQLSVADIAVIAVPRSSCSAYFVSTDIVHCAGIAVIAGCRVGSIYAACSLIAAVVGADIVVITVQRGSTWGTFFVSADITHCAGIAVITFCGVGCIYAACSWIAAVISTDIAVVAAYCRT